MEHISTISGLRNILITISYNGKGYHGWQIQNNALTVQQVFQEALTNVVGEFYDLKGCSRTDSGVHANMYCISVKIKHPIPAQRIKPALNRYLPNSVVCLDSKEVDSDFHARYNCKSKQYVYKIWNSDTPNPFLDGYALHYRFPMDVDLLNKAGQSYVGKKDFTSFCTQDKRKICDFTRNVKMFSVERDGNMVLIKVEADGFLYNMVRIMVGTILAVSQGKIPPDGIDNIIEKKDRTKAGPTAPACGLYLNEVNY